MKKIYFILSSSFVLAISSVFGQQLPQYSQFARNQFMVNPAACGIYDFVDVTIGGRYQWAGFDNAPKTGYAYIAAPIRKKKQIIPSLRTSQGLVSSPAVATGKFKHAVGGQLVSDQYGAFSKLSIAGTYALHLPITKELNLAFGTRVGLSNDRFDKDRAQVLSQMTGAPIYMNDTEYNTFVANQGRMNYVNVGAGLHLYSQKLFVGVTVDQLTKDFVKFGSGATNVQPDMYYQFIGGYHIPVSSKLKLTSSFLMKFITSNNLSWEGNVIAEFNDRIWGGLSYRNSKTMVAMAGITISNRFKFGYSYDFDFAKLRSFSRGGHEIILGIMLGRK
jgi:type IX secretion system PorP/SprF family membrane protein